MMLKPSSPVNIRINESVRQKKEFAANAEDAMLTAVAIIANLSKASTDTATIQSSSDALKSTYYNQFTKGDVIYEKSIAPEEGDVKLLDESVFYVDVAHGLPVTLTYVEIGGVRHDASDIIKMSIGNSAFIKAPMWKIDETGTLKVAVPYICAGADIKTGFTEIVAGGVVYSIPTFTPVENAAPLRISKAVIQPKDGCIGDIVVSGNKVSALVGHCAQLCGLVLNANGTDITDKSIALYVLKEGGNVSITVPEMCGSEKVTYAWYPFAYENRPVSEEEDGKVANVDRHIVVPGYGFIDVSLKAVKRYTSAE